MFEKISQEKREKAHQAILEGWNKRLDLLITKAKGASLWDMQNREFIDCTSQSFSLSVGACHARVIEAVSEQIQRFTHIQHVMDSVPLLVLTNKLLEVAPDNLRKVNYCLEGSVAVEGAMKLAMKNKPQGRYFIAMEHGYHGRTLATMAVSWSLPGNEFSQYMENVVRVPEAYCYRCAFGLEYPKCDLECVKFMEHSINNLVDGEPIAFIMEAIQGNGGQIDFPKEYHQAIRRLCDKYNIIFISDEIQTAFGMVGEMFAANLYETVPDILVFGKSIGGGFPLAGMLVKEQLRSFDPGEHATTFSHFTPSMVAASIVLDILKEEHLLERTKKLGVYIKNRLLEMKNKYEIIGDVRGLGLAIGVELVKNRKTKEPAVEEASTFIKKGLQQRVMFGVSRYGGIGNVVKIKPSLAITDAQVEKVLIVFEEIAKELNNNKGV